MRTFAVLSALCATALAHIEMSQPFPFRSKFDPNGENIDYSMTNPLDASGSDFPCKGYHKDGTPATAEYNAGQSYQLTLAGSATHNGGSCQISLSFDGGSSFQVIQSMMGGCPLTDSYDFTIPADTPSGDALLAWTWFNKTGNREMYMNCAPVKIGGGSSGASTKAGPAMFVANVGNGCTVPEGIDAVFAEPGPKVIYGEGVDENSPVEPVC